MPKVTKKTVKKAAKTVQKKQAEITKKAKDLIAEGRKRFAEIQSRPVWGKVRKGMEQAVDVVGRTAEKAAGQAVTMAQRAGTEYKIYERQRELQKQLADLGRKVYETAKADPQAAPAPGSGVRALIDAIRDTEKAIAELQAQATALKK